MRIMIAASEAVPFAKTGGLGDVVGALPQALRRLGHDVCVIMPAYRTALAAGCPVQDTGLTMSIPIGSKMVDGSLLVSRLPKSDVPVYLVRQDEYFDREGLYGSGTTDYKDNCERFVFFSRAVLEAVRLLDEPIDILHANDWPTGLIPAYLQIEYRGVPGYEQIATLFTIHNLSYQGQFWHWDMLLTGLDWKYFNWRQLEFFGRLNLMKTGLVFADAISTVSPRYADEIQTTPHGCGLEGVLHHRHDVLSGIINGVDYSIWDPANDPQLPATYSASTVADGKAQCKAALQQELGLPVEPRTPLVGLVGRLIEQKGIDLVAGLMRDWAPQADVQWAILGTGEANYEQALKQLAERFPRRVAVRLAFSEALAHRIEAGADIFLMPSQFEPCGLNQLYSLRYGAVPVVRATGGLYDTITGATEETIAAGTATGFRFDQYSVLALSEALQRAINCYSQPERWQKIVTAGMRQDWSWDRSATQYVALYESILARLRQKIHA